MSRELFDKYAHPFTAKWEGGLSDHPSDPGGITNHGVSLRWLKQLEDEYRRANGSKGPSPHDFNNDGKVDANDIHACTKKQAADLMFGHFWTPLKCSSLPLPFAVVLYDAGVNTGTSRSTRILQMVCNVVGEATLDTFTPLAEDGIMGPKTIAMCKALDGAGMAYYTARMAVRERQNYYNRLAKQKPSMGVFLKGWTNRSNDLLQHLANLEREEVTTEVNRVCECCGRAFD